VLASGGWSPEGFDDELNTKISVARYEWQNDMLDKFGQFMCEFLSTCWDSLTPNHPCSTTESSHRDTRALHLTRLPITRNGQTTSGTCRGIGGKGAFACGDHATRRLVLLGTQKDCL
jgi:hypothetical protein